MQLHNTIQVMLKRSVLNPLSFVLWYVFGVYCLPCHRPVLEGHEQKRAQMRRAELASQARGLVKCMRFEAGQGLQYLMAARQRSGSTNLDISDHDPGDPKQAADNLFDR